MSAIETIKNAFTVLKGNWLRSVGVMLLFFAATLIPGLVFSLFIHDQVHGGMLGFNLLFGFVVTSLLYTANLQFFLRLVDGEAVGFKDLLHPFKDWARILKGVLWMAFVLFFIMFGMLVLASVLNGGVMRFTPRNLFFWVLLIPVLLKAAKYLFFYFLLKEQPQTRVRDLIRDSKDWMQGHLFDFMGLNALLLLGQFPAIGLYVRHAFLFEQATMPAPDQWGYYLILNQRLFEQAQWFNGAATIVGGVIMLVWMPLVYTAWALFYRNVKQKDTS